MPHNRFEWLGRMKAVEREYAAMRQAADRFLAEARLDPAILRGDTRPRDAQNASDRLEGTYVMRLFAEFETGLRSFWGAARRSTPVTARLINNVAGMRAVPDDVCDHAHEVRHYRNGLVHGREVVGGPIPIGIARGFLCTFFDRLPITW